MPDEVVVDKALLKAIGAESRINILKSLTKRRKTQTELAQELGLSSPTVLEHLNQLVEAGLVEKHEEGRKWKYYTLTRKGKGLVSPSGAPVHAVILLAVGLIFVFSSLYMMNNALEAPMAGAPQQLTRNVEPIGGELDGDFVPMMEVYESAAPPEKSGEDMVSAGDAEENLSILEEPESAPIKTMDDDTEESQKESAPLPAPDMQLFVALFAIGVVFVGIGAGYYLLAVILH